MAGTEERNGRRALLDLEERFRSWRSGRKRGEKIPRALWQAAVELVDQYSLDDIAATLTLNLGRLERRVEATSHRRKRPSGASAAISFGSSATTDHHGFVEVEPRLGGGYPDECRVEAEDGTGKKLNLYLRSNGLAPAVEIARCVVKELWSVGQ